MTSARRDVLAWAGICTCVAGVGVALLIAGRSAGRAARTKRHASAAAAVSSAVRLAAHDSTGATVSPDGRMVELRGPTRTRTFAVIDADGDPATSGGEFFAELVAVDNPAIVARYPGEISPLPHGDPYFEDGPGGYLGLNMRFGGGGGAGAAAGYDLMTAVVVGR